jgi:hydrogenase maturation protease
MSSILVLGLGNILLRDEGFGVYVAQFLAADLQSDEIEVIEGATSGISLAWELENRQKIIVVDAINSQEPPGTIFRFNHSEINRYYSGTNISLHQFDFVQAMKYVDFLNIEYPDILFFCVQPSDTSPGLGLTDFTKTKIRAVANMIKNELKIN